MILLHLIKIKKKKKKNKINKKRFPDGSNKVVSLILKYNDLYIFKL
jgi:hypothetical protein